MLKTAVLTLALRGELPADAVLRVARAMTVAVSDTQTFALARPSVQALFALIAGVPVVQPGIVAHRLDDGRWAVSDVLPGGAAAAGGVGRGDILVSIDGAPIVHGWVDLVPFIGVPAGTKAELVVERDLIRRALETTAGNKVQAAKLLRISRKKLYAKIDKYGLD